MLVDGLLHLANQLVVLVRQARSNRQHNFAQIVRQPFDVFEFVRSFRGHELHSRVDVCGFSSKDALGNIRILRHIRQSAIVQ